MQCHDARANATSRDRVPACSLRIGFSSERNTRLFARDEEDHQAPSKGGSKPQRRPKEEARGSPDNSRAGLPLLPRYASAPWSRSNLYSVFSPLNASRPKAKCQVLYTIYLTFALHRISPTDLFSVSCAHQRQGQSCPYLIPPGGHGETFGKSRSRSSALDATPAGNSSTDKSFHCANAPLYSKRKLIRIGRSGTMSPWRTTRSSSIRKSGARGGSRTHMRKNPRRILSPQRLPFRHPGTGSV